MLGQLLTQQLSEHTPLVIMLLLLLLVFLGSSLVRRFVDRLAAQGHLQPTMATRLHLLRRGILLLVTPLILLQVTGLGQHAWTLLSAILATIAIGFFAVWSLLANATSALTLLAFRPFRVGDDVDLVEPSNGTALSGRIEDMNLMFTTLREHQDGKGYPPASLQIPNSLFFQKAIRVRPQSGTNTYSTPFFAASQVPKPPETAASPRPPSTKPPA